MLKIALFCDTPKNKSGVTIHCWALKKLLESSGEFSVSVFSSLPYKRYFSLFNVYNKAAIKEALLSEDFDIIHIHGFISTIPFYITSVMKSLKISCPMIYTPHAHPFYTLNHPLMNRLFFHLFVKRVLKKANHVISINKEDFAFFKHYNANVKTIPHWFEQNAIKHSKGINEKPTLLFVGRNNDNKNLKVLYNLPYDKYNVVCVTNEKPERDDFIFKTQISNEELMSLYSTASLTIVPSRYEAFSYTAMESLCAGTPILLSNRVRIADFLTDVSGITIYDFNDQKSLVEKVDEAIMKPVDVEKVLEIFSPLRALNTYKQVYNQYGQHS